MARGRKKKEPKPIYFKCRRCKSAYLKEELIHKSGAIYYCSACYKGIIDEEKREEELSSLYALVCRIMEEEPYPKLKNYLSECVDNYTLPIVKYYFQSQESYLHSLLKRKTFKTKLNKLAYFKVVANDNLSSVKIPVRERLNQNVEYNDFNKYKRKNKRIGMAEIEQAILLEMGDDDE